jgi:hypothetical protein
MDLWGAKNLSLFVEDEENVKENLNFIKDYFKEKSKLT